MLTKSHLHYADAEGLQPKMKWDLKDARVIKKGGVSALPFRLLMPMCVGVVNILRWFCFQDGRRQAHDAPLFADNYSLGDDVWDFGPWLWII